MMADGYDSIAIQKIYDLCQSFKKSISNWMKFWQRCGMHPNEMHEGSREKKKLLTFKRTFVSLFISHEINACENNKYKFYLVRHFTHMMAHSHVVFACMKQKRFFLYFSIKWGQWYFYIIIITIIAVTVQSSISTYLAHIYIRSPNTHTLHILLIYACYLMMLIFFLYKNTFNDYLR